MLTKTGLSFYSKYKSPAERSEQSALPSLRLHVVIASAAKQSFFPAVIASAAKQICSKVSSCIQKTNRFAAGRLPTLAQWDALTKHFAVKQAFLKFGIGDYLLWLHFLFSGTRDRDK